MFLLSTIDETVSKKTGQKVDIPCPSGMVYCMKDLSGVDVSNLKCTCSLKKNVGNAFYILHSVLNVCIVPLQVVCD